MSRCFPYPPPGYLRNGARGEALSESIKLQRDGGKAITEHDKMKKEKEKNKQRNKDRKNKEGSYIVDTCNQQEKGPLPKGKEEEGERSGLTEEHEQPVSCSQSLGCSPDSTRCSKREVGDLPYDGIKRNGNVIRIRLPLQRHKDANASTSGEQLYSSGKSDSLPQQNEIINVPAKEQCPAINSTAGIITSESVEAPCSANLKSKTTEGDLSHGKDVQTKESLYKALIEEWVPPSMDQDNFDDQQWLFGTKIPEPLCKRRKTQLDESCHGSSTAWPMARLLPGVDIWALPYTIPF